jgi:TP901 family phage tail tape measure protein
MADQDTKVKIVDIQIRYKEAVDAMAQYRTAIDEAKNRLKELKKELKDGKITQQEYNKQSESSKVFIKQQTEAINTLSKQVSNQIKTQNEQEGSLRQLRAELSNATAAYDAMSRAEREGAKGQELKNHIIEITTELKNAEQGTLRFYRNVGNYPSSVDSTLGGITEKFRNLGKTILGVATGGSLAALGKSIIDVGQSFDASMARVDSVTQETRKEFEMMRKEALRVGAETAYSSTEAADSLENLTRNGLTVEQATAALMPTLKFAQANLVGLADAADIMTGVSNGFCMGVEGMSRVSDTLSWTASHSAARISELAEALKNAAPFGHALGQPIEEVNAALGVLADVQIRGADAGTALRMVMLGLATSTAQQQKVFKEFGININQQTMKADGLTKTLEKLKASGIMEAADSADKLADVFGRRVSPQVMALLNNIDGMKEKLDGLKNSQGATAEMYERSMDAWSLAAAELDNQLETMKLKMWDEQKGVSTSFVESLNELLGWINANFSTVANAVMSIIAGISFAKLINNAMSAFTQMKESAVSNAQAATATVQTCQNEEIALRRQCATLTTQLESASATERERIETQLVAKKRELANAEKATQKAKAAEITMWERAAALETGNRWQQAFTVAKMGVTSFVATAKTAFRGFILTAVLSLAFELVMMLWNKLSEGEGVFANLKKWGTTAWNAIVYATNLVINKLIDLYNNFSIVRGAIQGVALYFKSLWEVVKLVFNLIMDGVKSVGRSLSGLGTILKGIFTLSWDDIKSGYKEIVDNFGLTIKEGVGDIKNFGKNVANNFVDAYNKTMKAAKVEHLPLPKLSQDESPKPKTQKEKQKEKQKKQDQTQNQALAQNQDQSQAQTSSKEDKARAKAAQEEAKLVAEAEKAMLDLLGESIEKRRAMLEAQYNGEISKLKAKLETDKTLTEKSRDAINQTITAKEKKLQEELAKLDDENLKIQIQNQQKLIDSRLSIVRKGAEGELNLKIQQGQKQLDLDLVALKQEEEAAQKGAATSLMYRQQALAELEQSGTATEEQLARAREAVAYAQSQITSISENYAEMRLNKQEEWYNKEDELRYNHAQDVLNEQMQVYQNEIAALDLADTERMSKIVEDNDNRMTLQQTLDSLGLDVVTENEMRKLEIQQQMAQERLNFILQQGQLETETEAQYNARVIAGKQAVADSKAKINQASIKNEQAYAKAMANVGDSLISLLDTIGEHDKNFAMLSKIITLFKITVDTGKALSSGIASAMELPFPANLAAVATTVATVLTNIGTAISTVNSAKFAEGGKVTGPGTGTSDSIPANLSNGEFVMTAKATAMFEPLLVAMNAIGKGVPMQVSRSYERISDADMMSQSFTDAVENIRPVVSVEEITETQKRVEVIQNLDTF